MKIIVTLIPINKFKNWLLYFFILSYESKTSINLLGGLRYGNEKKLSFVPTKLRSTSEL